MKMIISPMPDNGFAVGLGVARVGSQRLVEVVLGSTVSSLAVSAELQVGEVG